MTTQTEGGLLGLAFHPDYANNGYFYVTYTIESPRRTVLARFTASASPNVADRQSEVRILQIPKAFLHHNGGCVRFGPDGDLYLSLGDDGTSAHSQDLTSLHGKLLRIDVDHPANGLAYGIPPDNPFAGNASGFREEIYAYGFRNPWRYAFDTATGTIWLADVGQDTYEEIDLIQPGRNYGWPRMEGTLCYAPSVCDTAGLDLVPPLDEYSHNGGAASITGGTVYHGTRVPSLVGKYVFSDYIVGRVWALSYDGVNPPVREVLIATPGFGSVAGIGEDGDGELYLASFDGTVYGFTESNTAVETPAPLPWFAGRRVPQSIPHEHRDDGDAPHGGTCNARYLRRHRPARCSRHRWRPGRRRTPRDLGRSRCPREPPARGRVLLTTDRRRRGLRETADRAAKVAATPRLRLERAPGFPGRVARRHCPWGRFLVHSIAAHQQEKAENTTMEPSLFRGTSAAPSVVTDLPGPRSRALLEKESHHLAPGVQSIATLSGIAVARAEGSIIEDVDGNRFLDLAAGVCVNAIGHAHPRYREILKDQIDHVTVGSFTTPHRVEALEKIASHAPKGLDKIQLYSSGAEAVEAAMRLAKSYTKKYEFLSFWGGFHGKTAGTLSLIGDTTKHGLGPSMPGTYHTPYADCYRCPLALSYPSCGMECVEFARKTIRNSTTGALAAILVEPMQGTAGNVIPPPEFLPAIKEIAHENDALLIADEMITGFGRTGKMVRQRTHRTSRPTS